MQPIFHMSGTGRHWFVDEPVYNLPITSCLGNEIFHLLVPSLQTNKIAKFYLLVKLPVPIIWLHKLLKFDIVFIHVTILVYFVI